MRKIAESRKINPVLTFFCRTARVKGDYIRYPVISWLWKEVWDKLENVSVECINSYSYEKETEIYVNHVYMQCCAIHSRHQQSMVQPALDPCLLFYLHVHGQLTIDVGIWWISRSMYKIRSSSMNEKSHLYPVQLTVSNLTWRAVKRNESFTQLIQLDHRPLVS